MNDLLDRAENELLSQRPLVAIDYALEVVSRRREMGISDLPLGDIIALFVKSILVKIGGTRVGPLRDNEVDILFDQNLSQENQHFNAICLLRLLCTDDQYFRENPQFHDKTFRLFDNVFSKDLYKQLKIEIKDQNYKKESKLKDAVPKIESKLDNIVSSLNSLDMVPTFRKRFMQTMNGQLSKAILWPFLPERLLGISLDEIFSSIEQYRKSEVINILASFDKAQRILEAYLKEVERHGTIYGQRYLKRFVSTIQDLIKKHFDNSAASKPAKLVIEKTEKNYPLHLAGSAVGLRFSLKNLGPGHAFEVSLEFTTSDNLKIKHVQTYLGHVEPTSVNVEISAQVVSPESIALISVEVKWNNFDGSTGDSSFDFELNAQRSNIPWEDLSKKEPYNLEPVTTEEELVGRRDVISQLLARIKAKSMGSFYLSGQKRVGKTSVINVLAKLLLSTITSDFLVLNLDRGDYISADPNEVVNSLGAKICSLIRKSDKRFTHLEIPVFDGALSPLTDFLDSILDIAPSYRILFILDEFDELPIGLYKRGPIGDAFFSTIRSISGKPPFGFILVGGERMQFIMSCQGDILNKFQAKRLDYFGKEEHWADFQELVRRPVQKWVDISDDAVVALYERTAGHPFFTKCIAGPLFTTMVSRRDCHVTRWEVEETISHILRSGSIGSNVFMHFWRDGIFETGDRQEEVVFRRRRILLALAENYRKKGSSSKDDILSSDLVASMDPVLVGSDLREFERRQVLVVKDGSYDCKIPFFKEWLKERGINEIIDSFPQLDEILIRKREEDEAYVRSPEVVELVDTWGFYKGRRITEDLVRTWLGQFDTNVKQRLMFRILKNLYFYTEDRIRSKMKEAHGIVVRGIVREIQEAERKRRDVLISYLDHPGKSGAVYAKMYADENDIYYRNVVERKSLARVLREPGRAKILVFLDDFIGTADAACKHFKELSGECGAILRERQVKVFFIAVCGFETAQAKIESTLDKVNLPIHVHICDVMDESARVFSESSKFFPDSRERNQAKVIAWEYGSYLTRKAPLGYGDSEAAVVFPHSCPNNSLPILWSLSTAPQWKPLFNRS